MIYQKWPIQSSFWRGSNSPQFIFRSQVQNIQSKKYMNFDIIGPFEKSTKTPFGQSFIHEHGRLNWSLTHYMLHFLIYFDFPLIKKWTKSNKWWKLTKIWFDLFFFDRFSIKICSVNKIKSNQGQLVQERHDLAQNRNISYSLQIKSNLG